MNIGHKVGDTVLVVGEIVGIHITDKQNKPEYVVRIKGFGEHAVGDISIGEDTIYNTCKGDN